MYLSKGRLSLSEDPCRFLTTEKDELFSTLNLDLDIDNQVPWILETTCRKNLGMIGRQTIRMIGRQTIRMPEVISPHDQRHIIIRS